MAFMLKKDGGPLFPVRVNVFVEMQNYCYKNIRINSG